MSAARSTAGARHLGAARRSRAGRTLVALLGVGSLALTAAAAQPLEPGDTAWPTDVFAAGEGGFGSLGLLTPLDDDDEDSAAGADGARRGAGRPGGDGPGRTGSGGGSGAAVEVPLFGEGSFLGEETLASAVPGGLGAAGGIPAPTLRAYRAAAQVLAREEPGCAIDWALLAGIGRVEANHGRFGGATVSEQGVSVPRILGPRLDGTLAGTQVIRDTDGGTLDGDAAYDRAVGPMQFLPGTWQRWGSDGDRDGAQDPQDIDDAALAAARYLCEGRTGLGDPAEAALAVRRYNNSSSYVDLVLATAEGYRSGVDAASDPFGGFGGGGYDDPFAELYDDPYSDPFDDLYGDGGYFPFDSPAPPPGWTLPPGAPVGSGATTPGATPSVTTPAATPTTTAPTPTQTSQPAPTTAVPTSVPTTAQPTSSPTTSAPEPSGLPTGSPTGSPTGTPSEPTEPSASPTTATPSTTEPAPSCSPGPTATSTTEPSPGPGDGPTAGPCPVPCGTPTPSTEPSETTAPSPTCTPVPSAPPAP